MIEKYRARARIAQALAHPTRLMILDALSANEMCVGDLTAMVGADQSTVSKHLAVLKSAGIVADRRERNMAFYRLRAKCVRSFSGIVGCIEKLLHENLRAQQAALGHDGPDPAEMAAGPGNPGDGA